MIDSRITDLFEKYAPFKLSEAKLLVLAKMGSHSTGVHVLKPEKVRDVDLMMVVVPPASFVIGMKAWTEEAFQVQFEELDLTVYTLRHFIQLASKSNPNVLPLLWLRKEEYLYQSMGWNILMEQRHMFSSRRIFDSFTGFAKSQSKKMTAFDGKKMGEKRKQLVEKFGYDTHNACHTIRTLRMCCEFLETGILNVYREVDAAELCDVKAGNWSLAEVEREIEKLMHRAELAKPYSSVSEQPKSNMIDQYVQQLHLMYF